MTRRRIQKAVAASAVMAILLMASTAWGQGWGDGVQGGPFRLHPGVSLSAGFDSNVYYSSQQEAGHLSQAPEALIEPSLLFSTPDSGNWNLEGEASVGWRQFLTSDERVRGQSGLSASFDGVGLWNAEGPFSLQLSEQFVRTNETPNYASSEPINRIFNRAGIRAGLHPGGRILETYASYDFSLYRHDRLQDLDRHTHHLGWHANWSFLPRTALMAEVDYRMIRYNQEFRGQDSIVSPEGRHLNVDSNPVRLLGGIRGMITPRVTIGLRGGYGWSMYEQGANHDGILARVEASYQFGAMEFENRLRIGYERDFTDSTIGNYYTSHRAIAGYEQGFVDNRLRLELEVDSQIRNYAPTGIDRVETESSEILYPDGMSDLLVGVAASSTFEIRRGWTIGARYRLRSNFTEDVIEVVGVGEDTVRDYQRHHVLLTTELRY